jgi:hypothetical protein
LEQSSNSSRRSFWLSAASNSFASLKENVFNTSQGIGNIDQMNFIFCNEYKLEGGI